ncbi:MAG: hypothetical protein IJ526_06900 [Lachnospiraceae bacterium]|nr:hypothetical protein [Lachnospiraceae bacterium]MBQ8666572.1 hypothetical protein [Lachnospiraceae bacterium]
MGLLKSKAEKELDKIIQHIDINMSNNYKDAAQVALKEFEPSKCRYYYIHLDDFH